MKRGLTTIIICIVIINLIGLVLNLTPAAASRHSSSVIRHSPPTAHNLSGATEPDTYTDARGNYRFEGLPRGTHKVTIDPTTLPSHLRPAEGESVPVIWLNPGQSQTSAALSSGVRFTANYDAASGTISGTVFLELDGDAQLGLSGVRVIDPTVHQYFVPFDDHDLWTLFEEKAVCHEVGEPEEPLHSYVFLTAGSDGTVYYYDHWEDGYDVDPLVPGPTTEAGVLGAGVTELFQSDITIAQLGSELYYDGRDRITIFGEEGTVVRLAYPQNPGTFLASAWEVPEAANWGIGYVATVGEDLDFNGADVDDHDYTGLEVMAWQDGTKVYYNNAQVATLDTGEVYFIDGGNDEAGGEGVDSADVITAAAPIQVQMMTGACGPPPGYSAHGYTLQPVDVWDNAYWAPVPGFDCGKSVDTDVYLHNPNSAPISVTATSDQGVTVLPIAAHTTASLLDHVVSEAGWADVSTGASGIRLFSEATFGGMAVIDSSTNGNSSSQQYDWAYSLIPESELSSQVVVGYAPGTGEDVPEDNGSLAFVTAVTDTVVYVDLNQDNLPDPFDMNGDGDQDDQNVWGVAEWDESLAALGVPLASGQSLRVGDPNDHDLMGARIYTLGLDEKLAVAWGQDPCYATSGIPYLDLGYTIFPLPVSSLSKSDNLAIDADLTGDVSPGDTLTYTITIRNNGLGSMNEVVLTDTLPYTYTNFLVGSLDVSSPPPVDTIEYYTGTWGTTPSPDAQAFRIKWDTLQPDGTIVVNFRAELLETIPITLTEITNLATVDSANTPPRTSEDPQDPADPDTDTTVGRPRLSLKKMATPDTVRYGSRITYTIVVSNTGTGIARGMLATDVLPEGVAYIPGTLDITWPHVEIKTEGRVVTRTTYFHGHYADDFDSTITQTSDYAGNDGNLDWTSDWNEYNDDNNPDAGEIRVTTATTDALSAPGSLWMMDDDEDDAGVWRIADLSDFISPTLRYYVTSTTGITNGYRVEINGDNVSEEIHDGGYAFRELCQKLCAYAGQPVTVTFLAPSDMEADEQYRFDNIAIYESTPQRTLTHTLTWEQSVLSYTTSTGGDPHDYDPASGQMVITEDMGLPASGIMTVTFQARVTTPLTDGGALTNTAYVTAENLLFTPPWTGVPVATESSHVLTLTKKAQAESSASDEVVAGQLLTYTLAYSATGDEIAPNVIITDRVPNGAGFFAASGGIDQDTPPLGEAGLVTWQLGDLLSTGSGLVHQTGTVTLVVRVGLDWTESVITNTAHITDDEGVSDIASASISVNSEVYALSLDKSSAPVPAVPGQAITYTLVVTNAGPGAASVVTLTDNLPSAILTPTYAPSEGDYESVTGAWSGLTTLDAGGRVTLTISGLLDPAFTGTLQNTASLTPGGESDGDTNTSAPQADLSIRKSAVPTTAVAGEPLTYTLVISNAGPSDAQDVTVTDTLPDQVTLVEATAPYTYAAPDLIWNLGTLPADETRVLTVVVTVNSDASGSIVNSASITSTTTDPNPSADDDEESTDTTSSADLSIRKSAVPTTAVAGAPLTYTLVISNAGPSDAQDVTVTDTLPDQVTLVEATAPYTYAAPDLIWDLGTLPADETRVLTVVVTVNSDASGSIVNSASVTSTTTDPDPGEDDDEESTDVSSSADISIEKVVTPITARPGDPLTYTLVVSNAGPSDAQDVVVTDTLPDQVTLVEATAPYTYTAPYLMWNLGTLPPDATRVLTVVVTVNPDASGSIVNTASVTSTTTDPDPESGDDDDDGETVLDALADVWVEKSVAPTGPVNPGDVITWTISYGNLGPTLAAEVNITDTLPAGLAYGGVVSAPLSLGDPTVSLGQLSWYTPVLEAGTSGAIIFTATVEVETSQTLTNSVAITSVVEDNDSQNNQDALPFEVQAQADLAISKSVIRSLGSVTYTVIVRNLGPGAANGASMTDNVPDHVTDISWTCVASGGAACNPNGVGNEIVESLSIFPAGGVVTYTVGGNLGVLGDESNLATIAPPAGVSDPDSANNSGVVGKPYRVLLVRIYKQAKP